MGARDRGALAQKPKVRGRPFQPGNPGRPPGSKNKTTRLVEQPVRKVTEDLEQTIIAGAYWLREPRDGAELAIAYCGAVAPEALAAHQDLAEDVPDAGLLAITSPDRLHRDWRSARARGDTGVAERLLARLRPGAALVTVGDFHPATLSWLGAVAGNTIVRRRPLWPIRRHPRSLPRLRYRHRRDPRRRRRRLSHRVAADQQSLAIRAPPAVLSVIRRKAV